MEYLHLVGRSEALFAEDIAQNDGILREMIGNSNVLVIGAAGSIGQAVTREIFKRNPKSLHAVDISENNLVELVRDVRSTLGYIKGDFQTFAIDSGSDEFAAMLRTTGHYDYVLNLSALKHVRSERDPFTLMRMINVNILNTIKTIDQLQGGGLKKYFCVSTDKAANPVNMMGASKRIMELFMMRASLRANISTARFANVAFSDGSLLHGFNQRFFKKQPIAAPVDVQRYFVTPQESGELCLMSCLLGENREIFFPKLDADVHQVTFSDIAVRYLENLGYAPYLCDNEEEARGKAVQLIAQKKWPCYFFESDTTGEKEFEEFYTPNEEVILSKFKSIGVIANSPKFDGDKLDFFLRSIHKLQSKGTWAKSEILDIFIEMLPEFNHKETGKYLDQRM